MLKLAKGTANGTVAAALKIKSRRALREDEKQC
jgi:hypothetical protein